MAFRAQTRRPSLSDRNVPATGEPPLVTHLAQSPDEDHLARAHGSALVVRGNLLGLAAGPWPGWLLTLFLLAPVLLAIWTLPGFITQDGPAHLYNAVILADSFDPQSPYQRVYEVRWEPFPNWAGHLALVGLLRFVSPWAADRLMMSATLLGFAWALVWLRWRVRGGQGMLGPCLLAALLSANFLWLMGFTSFLLGACFFPITLGVWWTGRDRAGYVRPAVIMLLLLMNYFCHLVSLGLTALGLALLALLAPSQTVAGFGLANRLRRLGRTAMVFLPVVPLGFLYLQMSRRGGPMHPTWENLSSAYSLSAWGARLGWVDPLTVAIKVGLPFTSRFAAIFFVFAPVVWLSAAGFFWWAGRLSAGSGRESGPPSAARGGQASRSQRDEETEKRDQGVWILLASLLIVAGVIGPDSLGPGHGEYLPQRLILLGLAALVPALDIKLANKWGRLTAVSLGVALLLQTLILWDYALYSQRTAGQIIQTKNQVGRGKRIATLLLDTRSRFRVDPLRHADNWLGVGTGNIVWNNYETRYYYFPVQFRRGIDRPDSSDLEWLAIHDNPSDAPACAIVWKYLLAHHSGAIDTILVWRDNPTFSAITAQWFEEAASLGDVRIYKRREGPARSTP